MRIAITGTPGTGKTSAIEALESGMVAAERIAEFEVLHLNEIISKKDLTDGYDEERDTVVANLEALGDWLDSKYEETGDILFESHLAHHFEADRLIVLRCHPETLEERLAKRGESEVSIAENAESEALDVILSETVEQHSMDTIYEIDTTDRTSEEVAQEIAAIIKNEREPQAGIVTYIDYL